MRTALVLGLVMCNGVALAAPVPADAKAERAKLERLWADLKSWDVVTCTRAVLALIDHPQAVPLLKEKLPPVAASKEQVTRWLKDLNGADEKARDRAFEELRYFDPRIALTVAEQIELSTSQYGRRKLHDLWFDWGNANPYIPEGTWSVQVVNEENEQVHVEFTIQQANGHGRETKVVTARPIRTASITWRAATLGVLVLDRIGTPEARRVLERLATGHPDAAPTVAAKAVPLHGPPAPLTDQRFDAIWRGLWYPHPLAAVDQVLALADDPRSAALLKVKLPPIQAAKKQILAWLADLDSADEKVWKPALRSLQYHHPLIAVPLQDQIGEVTTDAGRSRLLAVYLPREEEGAARLYENLTLEVRGESLAATQQFQRAKVGVTEGRVPPLSELSPAPWTRVRLAVLALERQGTTDAVAVLKQLAAGHDEVLPTIEAKAALKRLGK